MKNLITLLFITLSFVACDKADDEITPTPPVSNNEGNNPTDTTSVNQNFYITGKADGVRFISRDDIRFTYAREQFGTHQWIGLGDTLGSINLQISNVNGTGFNGVGRYDHSNSEGLSLNWNVDGPRDTYNSDSRKFGMGLTNGFVIVTAYDSTIIEGTFEFTGESQISAPKQVTITEGKFRLQYK